MIIKLREKKMYIPPDKGIFIFFRFYGNYQMGYLSRNWILKEIYLENKEKQSKILVYIS